MTRHLYPAGRHTSHTDTQFLRATGRAQFIDGGIGTGFGYPMIRDGSVVGVSCCVDITSHTSNGTITVEVYKDNGASSALIFSATSPTISATGEYSWDATQDAGIDDISQGDVLWMKIAVDSGSFTWTGAFAAFEVEHDEP